MTIILGHLRQKCTTKREYRQRVRRKGGRDLASRSLLSLPPSSPSLFRRRRPRPDCAAGRERVALPLFAFAATFSAFFTRPSGRGERRRSTAHCMRTGSCIPLDDPPCPTLSSFHHTRHAPPPVRKLLLHTGRFSKEIAPRG